MPLLFSNSQQEEIKKDSNTTAANTPPENEAEIKPPMQIQEAVQKLTVKKNNSPTRIRELASDMTYETLPGGEKECEDELVLLAENSPCSEKRKMVQNQVKKKKRLECSNESSDEKGPSHDGNHYAEAYFMKAKSTLDEGTFQQFITVLSEAVDEPGAAVALYNKMTEILVNYPQLLDDFIGFLRPHQAKECGKLMDLQYFEKCWSFFKKLDAHHGNRFHNALEQQVSNNVNSSETIKASILPIFKGSPHLSEAFLHLLPDEKPPPSSKEDFEDISEVSVEESGWERIRIPEHPDRGCQQNCNCKCHTSDPKLFCLSCNLKFLNGQIYIRDGKVLRFARISFGETPLEEMLQKLHPALYSKRREKRRTSKSVSAPNKEVLCEDENAVQTKEDLQPASSPDRCDKTEEEDDYWEEDDVSSGDKSSIGDPFDGSFEDPDTCDSTRFLGQLQPVSPIYSLVDEESQKGKSEILKILDNNEPSPKQEITQVKTETEHTSSDIETIVQINNIQDEGKDETKEITIEVKPKEEEVKEKRVWTREEDKMILQTFQKELGTEQTFSKISNLMPSRSVNDIQGRFQVLMNLLEKVASGSHDAYPA